MMEQDKKYLSDILQAIELVESFTFGIISFEQYLSDIKTRSAVERQLSIIGEAVNKYEKLFPGSQIVNGQKIVGFRNRLVHSYDTIDQTIVWAILKNYLASLKSEVTRMLQS